MPNRPFRHKLMRMVLLTSGLVILFTCAMFVTYEVVTFKQSVEQQLNILGKAIAQNSTAALAFDNASDARVVLAAFRADPHIVSAALYEKSGQRHYSRMAIASRASTSSVSSRCA